MIKKLIHFIFVLFLLALVVGVPSAWMIRRSYNDPEVHYFYLKTDRFSADAQAEGTEAADAGKTDPADTEKAVEEETEADAAGADRDGTTSLRFVVLSDLYGYVFEGGNGVIADLVTNTFPDAILIDGNLIDGDAEGITQTTDLIKRLAKIAPVYYSYGDEELKYVKRHSAADTEDKAADPLREELKKAGATVLNGEYKDVQLYGVSVRLGGMNGKAYELTNLYGDVKRKGRNNWELLNRFQKTDRLKIMMSNRTDDFLLGDACDTWQIDTIVSGNELGGLVVLPYYGGVFSSSQGYFPGYIHGMYKKGNCNLLITSGLSAPAGRIPRFNNPPEIAVLDIDGLKRAAK